MSEAELSESWRRNYGDCLERERQQLAAINAGIAGLEECAQFVYEHFVQNEVTFREGPSYPKVLRPRLLELLVSKGGWPKEDAEAYAETELWPERENVP